NSPDMAYCQFCGARMDPAAAGRPRNAAVRAPVDAVAARPVWDERARERAFAEVSSPAAPLSSARLIVIAQDGTPGREYVLSGEQTDVGREEGNILLPNDPYVSPRHARVSRKNASFFVRDLGSVNGVYVRLRRPMKLEHADLVLIGLEVLRFEVVSDAEKGLGPAAERGAHVFGSPAAPRFARLCQRTVEGVTRDVFYLTREETIIGRESGDIVFTSDPFMSRRHVAITRDARDGRFTLRDLGSSNGTYLAIRGEIELESGDHVRIGQHLFRLDVDPGGQS
ncbi:MAG TPA: FHA domain-containing protein, partial [Polyangiaceae bacterium]|nr:FHA domain-containing protein [Polyangiaceae bacterium]